MHGMLRTTLSAANAGRSGNDLQTRKMEIFITHNQFGRVWMGAGDPVANGVMNTVPTASTARCRASWA